MTGHRDGALRTVLWFAHECAPYHRPESTIGAQRPAQLARHLPAFGWRAVVVCCDAQARGRGENEAETRARVQQALVAADPDSSVIVPTSSQPSDGWLDGAWRRLLPDGGRDSSLKVLARKSLTAAKFLTGDYSQAWQPTARLAADAVNAAVGVNACIGEHSPDAGLFLARQFSWRHGVPWIADFRDPILSPLRPLARLLYEPRARHLLRSAAAIVNVTPVWSDIDRRLWGRPVHCIPNGFEPEDYLEPLARTRNDRLTVAYTGSLHAPQRLDVFLKGLALARQRAGAGAALDIQFLYRGPAADRVRSLAQDAGVARFVDIGGRVDRATALQMLRRADLLLLLSARDERDEYYARGFYPAKTFEYFGARRPILCVPGDHGILDRLIDETETGVVLRDAEAVAEYLVVAWRAWSAGHGIHYQPADDVVRLYTRRAEAARLAQVLDHAIGVQETAGVQRESA